MIRVGDRHYIDGHFWRVGTAIEDDQGYICIVLHSDEIPEDHLESEEEIPEILIRDFDSLKLSRTCEAA